MIVDFGRYRVGQEVTVVNSFGSGSTAQVMRMRVTGPARDHTAIPARLSDVDPLVTTRAVTRDLRFTHHDVRGMAGWAVNGSPFSPDAVFAAPALGEVEIWRLYSDFHHPVHLHLAQFQVLSRGIGGPGPFDAGWMDTVDLRPAEQATIAVRFDDYPGRYVLHCHNLEHEDMAMMATFTVS